MSDVVDYEAKYNHLRSVLSGLIPTLQDHVTLLNHVAVRMTGATGHCNTMAESLTALAQSIERELRNG
jgi:hypothetical protein